jgi:hypothetical protein
MRNINMITVKLIHAYKCIHIYKSTKSRFGVRFTSRFVPRSGTLLVRRWRRLLINMYACIYVSLCALCVGV